MGFFLVGRARDDGSVVLISDQLFETRQEAVDALSSSPVGTALQSECYVVDLDAATPILVVQAASAASEPAVSAEEPELEETASVWEAPEEEAAAVEEPAEEAAAEEAPAEAAAEEEPSLADALSRAADTLEAEGITAPDSIGPAPAVVGEAETVSEEALDAADEAPAGPAEPQAWPWDVKPGSGADEPETAAEAAPETVAEPEPVAEPVAEPEPEIVAAYVPDSLEEPAADVSELVMTRPDEELPDASRPVILGSYGEEAPPAAPVEELPLVEVPVPEPPLAEAPVDVAATSMGVEEPPAPEPPAREPPDLADVIADLEIESDSAPTSDSASAMPPPIDPAPASFGDDMADLASLTCEDCVYLNTCPNKGELDPSSCGSFQWKST